jgi:tRNA threonylcarbamoyladenosine biosynthesis protein TsaB
MILALETATSACSVAVATADGLVLAETVAAAGPAHTRRLLADTHHALSMAGADLADIDAVIVGLGPGTFTGLRIGIATARALAQATGAALRGVPTLATLALALAEGDAAAKARALVPLIDGKRGEVFAACYCRAAGYAARTPPDAFAGPLLEVVRDLSVLPAAELQDFLASWPSAVVGGDGAHLYAAELPASAHLARAVVWPTAGMTVRAWHVGVPGIVLAADDVLPLYGRAPDAVRWTERARRTAPENRR